MPLPEPVPENYPPENRMGYAPVNKLLLSIAVPMMISMMVQAMYNMVDSMFVGHISETDNFAFAALSYAFPIQNLMMAFSVGMGVGMNALLGKALGEKKFSLVGKIAGNSAYISLFFSICFTIFGLFFAEWFFTTQTSNQAIINYGVEYISWNCAFSITIFLQVYFVRLLIATGKTMYSMVCQIAGAIVNCILDPIFIFGYFGFPRMEVTGAAIATVIGQAIAASLAAYFNFSKNHEIKLNRESFKLDLPVLKRVLAIGLPSCAMQAIGSIMVYGFNKILTLSFGKVLVEGGKGTLGELGASVFNAFFKLQSFILMPAFGLNNGMVPIISYNFGARKKERIIKVMKLVTVYQVVLMSIGFLIFELFPSQLLRIFNATEDMLDVGVPALRNIGFCFVFIAFNVVFISSLQALGHSVSSLLISMMRQLGVILPVAYFMSLTGNIDLVWWSVSIAEGVALIASILFWIRAYRKEVKYMTPMPTEA
jgi:putative MATE family efflux protein